MVRILLGLMMLVVALTFIVVGVVQFVGDLSQSSDQLDVPGTHEFEVPEAGTYVLFHVYRGSHDGRVINVDPVLPNGATITLVDENDQVVASRPGSLNLYVHANEMKKQSVQAWDLSPGHYSLSVENLDEPHVITFDPLNAFWQPVVGMLVMMGLGVVSGLGGILLIVFGVIGNRSAKRPESGLTDIADLPS